MLRVRGGLAAAAVAAAAAAACSGGDPELVAGGRIAPAPPEPAPEMGELAPAPGTDPAPFTGLARSANVSVDARLLVITADGTNAALDAITSTLDYLGTPYDVLDATSGATLTADLLASGDRGRYYGIVLDTGDLAHASASAFSPDEWMTLASYEARFGVRRVVLYAYPSAAYGLVPKPGFDVAKAPIAAGFTADGKKAFTGANVDTAAIIDEGWAYPATATDSGTTPLLVDPAGNIYAAVRRYPDGREAMVLTFSQSSHSLATLALAYGMVSWVTQGIFLGERHVYASPQIDDLFVTSALYPGTGQTYRMTGADMQTFADWQRARQANPVLAGFRASWVFNGYGARVGGADALTSAAMTLASRFTWISHTWDHRVLTGMSYASAFDELTLNNQFAIGAALAPYRIENLVTPEISGLDNAEAMRAAWDVGIRQLAADTAKPEGRSKTPNSGIRNVVVPDLLEIPRRPTEVYFNVSQPAEWIAEYTAMYPGTYTYEKLVSTQSEQLLRYLLRGENCPWMFHQANVRDNGGGHSLLRDVLDAAFDRYLVRASFPVVSPTMEELAERVRGRMRYDAAVASATLGPGAQVVVRVKNAAAVPVTGLCTPAAESYGGQKISYLAMAAGASVTLSLADCNPSYMGGGGTGGGAMGTAGAGGTAGASGGGAAGASGGGGAGTSDGGVADVRSGDAAGTSDGGAADARGGGAAGASGNGSAGASGGGVAGAGGRGGAAGGGAWVGGSAGAGGAGPAVSGAGGSAGVGTGSGGASAESPGADAGASDGPAIHMGMGMGGLTAGAANDAGGCGCSAAGGGVGSRSLWWVALSLMVIALHISSTRRPRR